MLTLTTGTSLMPLVKDASVPWSRGAVFHQFPRGNKMGKSVRVSAGYLPSTLTGYENEWRLTIWVHWRSAGDQEIIWWVG